MHIDAERHTCRSNDNVNVFALFHEEGHFGLDELLRHLFRISALTFAGFLEVDLQELGTEGLDLFASRCTSIKTANDSTHAAGLKGGCEGRGAANLVVSAYRSDRTQSSNAGPDDEDLAWWDLKQARVSSNPRTSGS